MKNGQVEKRLSGLPSKLFGHKLVLDWWIVKHTYLTCDMHLYRAIRFVFTWRGYTSGWVPTLIGLRGFDRCVSSLFLYEKKQPVFTVWLSSFVREFFQIPFEMESLVAFLAFFLQYEATFLGVSSTSSSITRARVYGPGSIIWFIAWSQVERSWYLFRWTSMCYSRRTSGLWTPTKLREWELTCLYCPYYRIL